MKTYKEEPHHYENIKPRNMQIKLQKIKTQG